MAERNVSFEGNPYKGKVGVPKKKIQRKKRSDPKFINYLLECLDTEKHKHMLKYVNEERNEFEVIYTDKKNKRIWNEKDVSLFKDLNQHLEDKLKRKHDHDKDEDWKTRFRANMSKTFGKYIKKIDSKKIGKCKRREKYEILERPKPLVGKAKKIDVGTEIKSPRKKITKTKNMEISLQEEDSQVKILKSLTSIPQGNRGNSKKEGCSTIVSDDSLAKDEINKNISNENFEEDIIKKMQFLSYDSLEIEVKKDNHYLCLSGNLHVGENRSDEMSFMEENRNDKMCFMGKNRNEEMSFMEENRNDEMSFMGENRNDKMSFMEENRNNEMSFMGKNRNDEMIFIGENRNDEMIFIGENINDEMIFIGENRSDEMSYMGENRNDEMSFMGENRNDEMNFMGENRNDKLIFIGENKSDEMSCMGENNSDKMELGDNVNLDIPQFDLDQWEYLLHDGSEILKDDPFIGNETDIEDGTINNIGDKSDWPSNFANFSLMEEDGNVIYQ